MQLLDSQNNVVGTFDSNSEVRVSGKRNTLTFNTKEGSTYKKLTLDVNSFKNFSIKKDDGSVIKLSDSTEEIFETIKQEFISFIEKQSTTVTDDDSDSETTNDEFTYVVIPGKIQKLFVHVGNIDDISKVPEYADFARRESIQQEGYEYRDGPGKFIEDVDGVVRWFCADRSFTISKDNETVFAVDIELTENSRYGEIFKSLIKDDRFNEKFAEGYINAGVGESYGSEINFNDNTVEEILANNTYFGAGAFISDSKVCFSVAGHFGYNGYGIDVEGLTSPYNSNYNIASFIHDDESTDINDWSCTYNGIRLLKKAIETGRALDIAVPIPRDYSEYSSYNGSVFVNNF